MPLYSRRGQWPHAGDLFALAEKAENLARSRSGCARGSQPLPSFGVELLADLLKGWPSMAAGQGCCEADARKLCLAPKVGDPIHLHLEAPYVSGQLVGGSQRQLVDLAVPLGPGRLTRVGEVEARDRRAALPTPVGWRLRAPPDRAAVGEMAVPDASDADAVDVEGQGSGRDRFLERGDDARYAQVLASGDQLDRLSVVERRDRLVHPDRDVLGVHHPQQPLADRGELGDALGARPRGNALQRHPGPSGAWRGAGGRGDVLGAEMGLLMDEGGLLGKCR